MYSLCYITIHYEAKEVKVTINDQGGEMTSPIYNYDCTRLVFHVGHLQLYSGLLNQERRSHILCYGDIWMQSHVYDS